MINLETVTLLFCMSVFRW